MKEQKDYGISLTRVAGMLSIILCHVFTFYDKNALSQLFNVGIYIFFLISGYLYSSKTIPHKLQWLYGRWKKLCIPIYLWVAIISLVSLICKRSISITEIVLFAFNAQGLSWIIPGFPSISVAGSYSGLGNLWFVSVIFICYVMMLIVKKKAWGGVQTTNYTNWSRIHVCSHEN